jgi:hypothetical protein
LCLVTPISRQHADLGSRRYGPRYGTPPSPPAPPVFLSAPGKVLQPGDRDGNLANRPICSGLGVTADGERDIISLWTDDRGDGEGLWDTHMAQDEPRAGGRQGRVVNDVVRN